MAQLCTHMPHLDLVDIGQDMSTTVRLMGTPNPMKKFIQIPRRYGPETQKSTEMCPVSALIKIFSF